MNTMYFDREDRCYFVPAPGEAAVFCRKNWAEDAAHMIRVADEVCRNYFLFDLPWDMERTYEPVIFTDEIDWSYTPNGDPEFVWQFNRHRYFICLGQAYQMTGNGKYAECFFRLIGDWMERVPLNDETQKGPWRMLETGLRGETWTKAIRYFKDCSQFTPEFVKRFEESLTIHAGRLVDKGGDARLQSNWSVLENSGLFEIALFLSQSSRTREWALLALKRIGRAMKVQILRDGYQWEQSPMYHNEVYHCLCCVLRLARINAMDTDCGILKELGSDYFRTYEETVHRMALCNLIWKKPDHTQFTQGDSDATDLRDKITMGAYLFKDPVLKYGGYDVLDYEDVWDFGMEACREYAQLPALEPAFTSYELPESGNYYLRDGFGAQASLLHFFCGPMSTGHCHGDKLHIDLVLHGEDVLVDAGRATYMNVVLRFLLKANQAHNTTMVDGEPFTTFEDSWYTKKLSLPVNRAYYAGKTAEYVQGGHLGYMDRGIFVNRRVIWVKPDIYVIADEFYSGSAKNDEEPHTYRQHFQFAPQGSVRLNGTEAVFEGAKVSAVFHFLTPGTKLELSEGTVSSHYNQSESCAALTASLKQSGFAKMITVITPGHPMETVCDAGKAAVKLAEVRSNADGRLLSEDEVTAVEIRTGDSAHMIVICHNEIYHGSDAYITGNCFGTGNVCVFDLHSAADGERVYAGEVLY